MSLRLSTEWLLALAVTGVAGFFFLNGSFFSSYSALHVDLSINLTAAHALRHGANPYGADTLLARATALGSPTHWLYDELFTSYIQPPTSALSLLPLTFLPWREATRLYLILNHVTLFAGVGVTLVTLRPTLPLRWLVAGSAVILAAYACIPFSFAVGAVDAPLLLLLAIGCWGYLRGHAAVAGGAIACAAAIKLIPGLLLLYFLWRREYRIVLWGAGLGLVLLLASLAYVGPEIYRTYLTETLPALTRGSSHYSNMALNAVIARADTPSIVDGQIVKQIPEVLYLDEVPSNTAARLGFAAIEVMGLLTAALTLGWRRPKGAVETHDGRFSEYYFVLALGLLISSSAWDTYSIWLMPVFLAAFLTPDRLLPRSPARWLLLGALAAALLAFNFPGDLYLFEPNGVFYHPDWVLGKMVEDQVGLYHHHMAWVIFLRLPALVVTTLSLGALVVWRRRSAVPVAAESRSPTAAVSVEAASG